MSEVHQPPGDQAGRRAVLRRPVRPARRAPNDRKRLRQLGPQQEPRSLSSAAGEPASVSFGNNGLVSRWRLNHCGPITHMIAPGWTQRTSTTRETFCSSKKATSSTKRHLPRPAARHSRRHVHAALRRPVDPILGSCRHPVRRLTRRPGSGGGLRVRVRQRRGRLRWARGCTRGGRRRPVPPLWIREVAIDTGKDQMLIRYEDDEHNDSLARLDPRSLKYGPRIPVEVGNASHQPDRRPDRGRHQQRGGGLRRTDR